MVKPHYTPNRGDVVWLEFDPQSGHEQRGHRPALVLSPKSYNELVGLALFCPITSKVKGYPFEVNIQAGKINGVALSDQVKSLDWQTRKASFVASAPQTSLDAVLAKVRLLLF
jgi:mRNA interferase MazF